MKKSLVVLSLMFLVLATISGCSKSTPTATQAQPVSLTIAAAASLQDAGNELKTVYTSKHPNITLVFTYAASKTLQKQIEEGAPADLFISAGKTQMDALAAKKLIADTPCKNLLGNELVLVAKQDRYRYPGVGSSHF